MEVFPTLARSTLSAPYTAGGSTLSVASVASFPGSGTFRVLVSDAALTIYELMIVHVSGSALAIDSHGIEGTTNINHAAGVNVVAVLTGAGLLAAINQLLPVTMVPAGTSHAGGLVPDPGGSIHSPPWLLGDDGGFHAPSGASFPYTATANQALFEFTADTIIDVDANGNPRLTAVGAAGSIYFDDNGSPFIQMASGGQFQDDGAGGFNFNNGLELDSSLTFTWPTLGRIGDDGAGGVIIGNNNNVGSFNFDPTYQFPELTSSEPGSASRFGFQGSGEPGIYAASSAALVVDGNGNFTMGSVNDANYAFDGSNQPTITDASSNTLFSVNYGGVQLSNPFNGAVIGWDSINSYPLLQISGGGSIGFDGNYYNPVMQVPAGSFIGFDGNSFPQMISGNSAVSFDPYGNPQLLNYGAIQMFAVDVNNNPYMMDNSGNLQFSVDISNNPVIRGGASGTDSIGNVFSNGICTSVAT